MENLNTQEFIKLINTKRLEHKNNWFMECGVVNNKHFSIKAYNTYIQILDIDDVSYLAIGNDRFMVSY